MWLGLSHPSIINILQCICTHPIDATCVYLLCRAHGNEHMGIHDAICDTFATVAQGVGFHVRWKQLHTLSSTMFHSSHQWVNIVLTNGGIRTLLNVVIADPTWMHLPCWSCATRSFVAYDVAQAKKKELSWSTTHWSFPPFSNWSVWMFRQTSWYALTWLCQCHVELQRNKEPSSFCLCYFSL